MPSGNSRFAEVQIGKHTAAIEAETAAIQRFVDRQTAVIRTALIAQERLIVEHDKRLRDLRKSGTDEQQKTAEKERADAVYAIVSVP